jgi:hypothetical protein
VAALGTPCTPQQAYSYVTNKKQKKYINLEKIRKKWSNIIPHLPQPLDCENDLIRKGQTVEIFLLIGIQIFDAIPMAVFNSLYSLFLHNSCFFFHGNMSLKVTTEWYLIPR